MSMTRKNLLKVLGIPFTVFYDGADTFQRNRFVNMCQDSGYNKFISFWYNKYTQDIPVGALTERGYALFTNHDIQEEGIQVAIPISCNGSKTTSSLDTALSFAFSRATYAPIKIDIVKKWELLDTLYISKRGIFTENFEPLLMFFYRLSCNSERHIINFVVKVSNKVFDSKNSSNPVYRKIKNTIVPLYAGNPFCLRSDVPIIVNVEDISNYTTVSTLPVDSDKLDCHLNKMLKNTASNIVESSFLQGR